ncbi:MAG: flagellar M-ring protein FliF, partial [Paracoccaceae bacterium]
MANLENIDTHSDLATSRTGLMATSSGAIEKIREGIDQPGFRRAFPTLLASITAVAALVLYWGMQQPDMTTLYSSLPEAEKSKVLNSLRNMGITVELDPVTG